MVYICTSYTGISFDILGPIPKTKQNIYYDRRQQQQKVYVVKKMYHWHQVQTVRLLTTDGIYATGSVSFSDIIESDDITKEKHRQTNAKNDDTMRKRPVYEVGHSVWVYDVKHTMVP